MGDVETTTMRMIIGIIIGICVMMIGILRIINTTSEAGTGHVSYADLDITIFIIGLIIIIGSVVMAYFRINR